MNVYIDNEAIAGFDIGSSILNKKPKLLHPSILEASFNSLGIVK